MLKINLFILGTILLFALITVLLPKSTKQEQTSATLSGVSLTLYPATDANAHWTFRADTVTNDPLSGETHLSGIRDGGRWLKEMDAQGNPTGKQRLDARLAAQELTIDRQDNLTTNAATITLIDECANIRLQGSEEQPVRVEQNVGFSGPLAKVEAPNFNSTIPDLAMTFDFVITSSSNESQTGWDMNATTQCIDGQIVPI